MKSQLPRTDLAAASGTTSRLCTCTPVINTNRHLQCIWVRLVFTARCTITYLSSTQSSNGGSQADIKRCIVLASSVMSSLHHVWRDRYLSSPTKNRVYQALVLPVLLYACEAWTVTVLATDAKRLEAFCVPYEVPTPNYEDPLVGPYYTEHRSCVTHRPLPSIGPHHASSERCLWTHR